MNNAGQPANVVEHHVVSQLPYYAALDANDAHAEDRGITPTGSNVIPGSSLDITLGPDGQPFPGHPAGVRKNIILSEYELGRLDEREECLKETKRDKREATPKYKAIEAEKQKNIKEFDKMMEEIRKQWSEEQNGGRRKSSKRKGRGIRGKILTKRRIKRRRGRLTRRGYIAKYPSRN
jgi:hypothetical protein